MNYNADCWYVYALTDPRDGISFYIGLTATPERRLGQHHSDWGSGARRKCEDLKRAGLRARLDIIATFTDRERAKDYERRCIIACRGQTDNADWLYKNYERSKYEGERYHVR